MRNCINKTKDEDIISDRLPLTVFLLLIIIFGGIICTGILGAYLDRETTQHQIEQCSNSRQCVEQVKALRNDSIYCYQNDKCRTYIKGLK